MGDTRRHQGDKATARGTLETHAPQLLAWEIEGISKAEQRRRLGDMGVIVGRQSLYKFHTRHKTESAEPKARVQAAVVALAESKTIAEKSERIRRASLVSDKLMEWIEAHGLVTETQTVGEDGEQITNHRFNRGLVSAVVDVQTYVAKEQGDWEADRPPDPERQDHGFSTLILAGDGAIRAMGQGLFEALANGARDAGGSGLVRKRSELAAGATPDADQRRAAEDRER